MRAVAAACASAVVVAACGSSSKHSTIKNAVVKPTPAGPGTKRFSAPGMAIHFDYPGSFAVIRVGTVARAAGNAHPTYAAVGLGPYDLLAVSHYSGLRYAVTSSNVAQVKPQLDNLVSRVAGRKVDGTVGSAGGLPAIFWPRFPVPGVPVTTTSQVATVFVGTDEYEIQCQATPARLAQIEAACRELFATLSASSS